MPAISNIVHQLETQRTLTQRELEKLNLAIKALTSLEGGSVAATTGMRRKPHFSAAARERIAAAQRARWRKIKATQKK
jgi:fumarate hydratase class II